MLLFLNDIAGSEILLILVFILIFFGSKSIPGIARTAGRTMRQIKDASQDVQNEIKKSGLDMKKDMNLKSFISDTAEELKRPMDQMTADINEVVDSTRKAYDPKKMVAPIFPDEPKTENQTETNDVSADLSEMKPKDLSDNKSD